MSYIMGFIGVAVGLIIGILIYSEVEAAIDGAVYNAVTKIHPTINYYGVDTNLATFVYPRVTKNNLDTWKRKAEQYERYSGGYRTYMRYVEGAGGRPSCSADGYTRGGRRFCKSRASPPLKKSSWN